MKRNRPFAFVMLRLGDEERNVADWARHLGVKKGLLYGRLMRGWSPERTLTEPAARAVTRNYKRPLLERFMEKVSPEPTSGCWLWVGAYHSKGYGFIVRGDRRCDAESANRTAYRLFKGDPAGLFVCHRCDNPVCVNPDHLFLGTPKDNYDDMVQKGRRRIVRPKNVRTKVSAEQVADIRSRRLKGAEFARLYGVSKSLITRIQKGERRVD